MDQRSERLRGRLRELHEELAAAQALEPELRAELERLLAELQAALDRAEGAEHGTLLERLEGSMRRFEASHPALTGAVQRVVDALSDLGI